MADGGSSSTLYGSMVSNKEGSIPDSDIHMECWSTAFNFNH